MSNSLIVIVVATAAILLSATCHCIDVGIQKAAELEIQHDIEMKKKQVGRREGSTRWTRNQISKRK